MGSGRRTFAAGEVLTASNVMNYLQDQAVMSFAGSAARGSAVGTAVVEGMTSYLQDSNKVEVYTGSTWDALAYASTVITPGLVPIIPTSVDKSGGTATIGTKGTVTFSSTAILRLNGVFTSAYKHYRIEFRPTSITAGVERVDIRLSIAGVDTTSSSYKFIVNAADTTATNVTRQVSSNGGTSASVGYCDSSNSVRDIVVFNPQTADRTVILSAGTYDNGSIVSQNSYSSVLNTSSYDGINIYPSTGNFSGTLTVYGIVD